MRISILGVFSISTLLLAGCTQGSDTDTGDTDADTDTDSDTDTDADSDTDTDTDTDTAPDREPTACVEENGACVLSGTYTEDMYLTADKAWLLRSTVTVGDDVNPTDLLIEPGTVLYGESATNGLIVITRSSTITAVGTAEKPIVFTTDLPDGSRARGSWGGVVLNGRGIINACSDGATPCEAEGEGGTGIYGGTDNADSSGTLKYVRVEYGGTEISPDNEINGLSLNGVGSGTLIDYVQVHMNLDDGMEFWGGAVNASHVVISAPGDDGLDWDLGWVGNVQFAVVQQQSGGGNNGIEADNNPDDFLATPVTDPVFSNITLLGDSTSAETNFGLLLRRGTAGELHNVAVAGFSSACLAIRDQDTYDNFTSGNAALAHARFVCDPAFETDAEQVPFDAGSDNQVISDLGLKDAWSTTQPDFRPDAGSPLSSGGAAPSGSFFSPVTYIGAFDGTTDWTTGWTSFAAN